jgi:single-stranded-DNA-specific exonuclease
VLTLEDLCPTIQVDAVLGLNELNDSAISEVFALAPFGCGNPGPVFAVQNAELAGPPVLFKEKLLKVAIRQNGRTMMASSWNLAGRISELQPGAGYDFAICFEEETRGYGNWRATLKDFSPAN